ncbi:MAG: T9SS type A sorting domain-containing protein [Candidatus Saccharibacteria bacterium]|nr:T9SS type A sorting domain-containing protein [Candidatus Saccharibacteria bacterium]
MLCDKLPILINELTGPGDFSESSLGPCFRNEFQETNSIWLKWKVANAGSLAFTILPFNESDDIDFVLFRVKGLENCTFNESIRCMAAGPNLGDGSESFQGCTGATGLHHGIGGMDKSSGCSKHGLNFLRSIEMQSGEYYALFINNYRSSGGILIEWDGTGTFQSLPDCSLSSASSSLVFNNDGGIQFSEPFPNPVTERVIITANSDEAHSGQLQIVGADGQLELTLPIALSVGANTLELPTESLRNGVHFIKIKINGKAHLLRFVKL